MTSARQEADEVQVLSGIFEGRTTGTPISMLVLNTNARSQDYDAIRHLYRPGHADYSWDVKYGFRDYRGGGRSSARETVGRVAGGAIAKALLATIGVHIVGYTLSLGDLRALTYDEEEIERNPMRCPDAEVAARMVAMVDEARSQRDSLGGVVEVRARGVPPGLGEPVFDKLQASIGQAMFSIPAIKSLEFGEGLGATHMHGSEHNDPFIRRPDGRIGTATNHHGGILGGISTGEEIVIRLGAKPPASIAQEQQTVDDEGNPTTIVVKGRHDPTVLPRLVPIAEAMLALVLADHHLRQRLARLSGI
jgi:chorismate synthase